MINVYVKERGAKHTVFEYSAVCLSVIFELLPGLIPFATFRMNFGQKC